MVWISFTIYANYIAFHNITSSQLFLNKKKKHTANPTLTFDTPFPVSCFLFHVSPLFLWLCNDRKGYNIEAVFKFPYIGPYHGCQAMVRPSREQHLLYSYITSFHRQSKNKETNYLGALSTISKEFKWHKKWNKKV